MITVEFKRPVNAIEYSFYEYDNIEEAREDIKAFLDNGLLPDKDGECSYENYWYEESSNKWGEVYVNATKLAYYEYDDKGIKTTIQGINITRGEND